VTVFSSRNIKLKNTKPENYFDCQDNILQM